MATLLNIKKAVNDELAILWPKIQQAQEAWRTRTGTYCQVLPLSVVPDDGQDTAPDYSSCPSDQYELYREGEELLQRWTGIASDLFAGLGLPVTLKAELRVDVYQIPEGVHGYRATVRVSKGGLVYSRTAHVEDGAEVTTGAWSEGEAAPE